MLPGPSVSVAITSVSRLMADPALSTCEAWLSSAELDRLASITAPNRRRQFMAGRWWARQLLSARFDGQARDWHLSSAEDGPPQVTRGPCEPLPAVALSHSGDRVACAVTADGPLGLDIEVPRPRRRLHELAELALHPCEFSAWREVAPSQQITEFYALWTAKEAWIKSRGGALAPAQLAHMCSRPADAHDEVVGITFGLDNTLATVVCPANCRIDWLTLPAAEQRIQTTSPRFTVVMDD
jgi:4'-phosphopantetheinyl transferase